MNELAKELGMNLVPVICAALLGLIGIGIRYVNALAAQKLSERAAATANQYLTILDEVAESAVISVQQTMVDRLKKGGPVQQGRRRSRQGRRYQDRPDSLGQARSRIEDHLKVDVPKYMQALVEKALFALKQQTGADHLG